MNAPSTSAPAPRHARPFVAAFLAALVVCASAGVNPWPFSDWELFSRLRSDQQTRWEEVAIDATGRTHELAISSPPTEHRATCTAWLRLGAGHLGSRARLVRIYYLTWSLTDRRGEHAVPPHRTLELTCEKGTA
jgi:hypothetical protein